jgi:hypothetical protein
MSDRLRLRQATADKPARPFRNVDSGALPD